MNSEKIWCAAIKYRLKGQKTFKYMLGQNHAQCIKFFADLEIPVKDRDTEVEEQGFMTNQNRFVDRKEAKEIALNSGQISTNYHKDVLYSEYIAWYALL